MALADIHDADMAAILTDAGIVFTFDGVDYACIADEKVGRKELIEGGFMEDADLVIKTRVALFSTLPVAGQTLTYDSTLFRIREVRKNFSAKLLTLVCMTATR